MLPMKHPGIANAGPKTARSRADRDRLVPTWSSVNNEVGDLRRELPQVTDLVDYWKTKRP
jgi:hypothetical protein